MQCLAPACTVLPRMSCHKGVICQQITTHDMQQLNSAAAMSCAGLLMLKPANRGNDKVSNAISIIYPAMILSTLHYTSEFKVNA